MLNGAKLELGAAGQMPDLSGAAGSGLVHVPPTSYGFVVLHGVAAAACV
jgi:hypothetical protein